MNIIDIVPLGSEAGVLDLARRVRHAVGVTVLTPGRSDSEEGPDALRASTAIRPGDRVMSLVNDHQNGVHNGDVGVVRPGGAGLEVVINGTALPYSTETFAPANVISYHAAQGGCFGSVVALALEGCEERMSFKVAVEASRTDDYSARHVTLAGTQKSLEKLGIVFEADDSPDVEALGTSLRDCPTAMHETWTVRCMGRSCGTVKPALGSVARGR